MPTVTPKDILVTGTEASQNDATAAEAARRILVHLKRGNVALDRLRTSLERDEARTQPAR